MYHYEREEIETILETIEQQAAALSDLTIRMVHDNPLLPERPFLEKGLHRLNKAASTLHLILPD